MLLKLPQSLRFPITITKIHVKPGQDVRRDDTLFDYTFKVKVAWGSRDDDEDEIREETHGSKFESSVEGKLRYWKVWEGDVLTRPEEIAEIEEDCTHDIQVNGMCAICGKDMTLFNSYNSEATDADRAPIKMSHDTQSLTVSQEEASRVEDAAKRRLLASRRLSLVVDLDQTIIHATVDPTIALWQKDRDNPNYEFVQDVGAFQLIDDGPSMRGNVYYIKPRPGLMEFLERVHQMYEMHVYTMGTRQYAQQVANIIDPHRKYFGDRILSRDESGSLVEKSLKRLFPVDTRMVVIIDDRGDVWKWSDNLLKVIVFDFFPQIGDINSSFLPRKQETRTEPDVKQIETKAKEEKEMNGKPSSPEVASDASALEQLVAMGGGDDPGVRELQLSKQDETIASQVVEKPLLQMQKQLDEEDAALAAAEEASSSSESPEPQTQPQSPAETTVNGTPDGMNHSKSPSEESTTSPSSAGSTVIKPAASSTNSSMPHPRHAILNNNDKELIYLEKSLSVVHAAFFREFDRRRLSQKGGRVSMLSGRRKVRLPSDPDADSDRNDLLLVPDIKRIMPPMKHSILTGVVIVFSSLVPIGVDIQYADYPIWARSFGAAVEEDLRGNVTHLVTAEKGTTKVKQAAKWKSIKIVTKHWFHDCCSQWKKLDERPYLIELSRTSSPKESRDSDEEFLRSLLSESDEDSDLGSSKNAGNETESDTNSRSDRKNAKRLKLDTKSVPEAVETMDDTNVDDYDEPQLSPLTLDREEQDDIDQELKDFLGSDIDSDSDVESVASTSSGRGGPSKKRKRDEISNPDLKSDPDVELDSTIPSRNKQNVNNTSRLRNAITPPFATRDGRSSLQTDNSIPAGLMNGKPPTNDDILNKQADIESQEREEEIEEVDSDDELERELERELELGDYDDEDDEAEVGESGTRWVGRGGEDGGGFMGVPGGIDEREPMRDREGGETREES